MEKLIVFALAGLVAQLIDGSLGMGFGVIGTSMLVASGASAASASAVIHAAKVGTALVSGGSHWKFGNVHWRTVGLIGVPGALGAYFGATFLSNVDGSDVAPFTAGILCALGLYMLYRFAFDVARAVVDPSSLRVRFLVPLGLAGGVIDAIGGGGWGPVATPTLMTAGRMEPRTAIGSASLAELLVALGASLGFLLHLSSEQVNWSHVVALLAGAVVVAPFAAWVVKVMAPRVLGTLVGVLIVVLNTRTILVGFDAPGVLILAAVLVLTAGGAVLVLRSWKACRAMERISKAGSVVIEHPDEVSVDITG
ncbi:MAG: sulfite exporter TauE/SafE family protein [Microthrixaceae bacterium]